MYKTRIWVSKPAFGLFKTHISKSHICGPMSNIWVLKPQIRVLSKTQMWVLKYQIWVLKTPNTGFDKTRIWVLWDGLRVLFWPKCVFWQNPNSGFQKSYFVRPKTHICVPMSKIRVTHMCPKTPHYSFIKTRIWVSKPVFAFWGTKFPLVMHTHTHTHSHTSKHENTHIR